MKVAEDSLEEALADLPEDFLALVLADADRYNSVSTRLVKRMTEGGAYGVYITVNRPYETMKSVLEKKGVDLGRIFFIDCISDTVGGDSERRDNCLYIDSPKKLTDLGIALDEAINALGDVDKFIFLDSMSTLLIYNQLGTVLKFGHFLTGRLRVKGARGVFMSMEAETDERLVNTLSQFCDRVIEVE